MKSQLIGFLFLSTILAAPIAQATQVPCSMAEALVLVNIPAGEYFGTGCKVTVQRDPSTSTSSFVSVEVLEQRSDGTYYPYYGGRFVLSLARVDVVSLTKDIDPGVAVELVLSSRPGNPAGIKTDRLQITSDSVIVQTSPKPAYSCKIH